jgi:hypothetical protein
MSTLNYILSVMTVGLPTYRRQGTVGLPTYSAHVYLSDKNA